MPDARRPSPDALLRDAQREAGGRGRLKIFLGAAPGVGKTYEMLTSARARLREGVDVVAAVVETHGRAETQALLADIPALPRKTVAYKSGTLEEMDLDALLARRPALALVDELAHTNAPGSRHPKRHQDVEELLAAGIDVYTTLNIQHVESLNDVVAQITRIRVRETVPDSVLDRADDVEIVDLSPADLIQRLKDGKVYLPRNAERALRHYFSQGNLTALRELALRRTAQRVDDELLVHMQAHAIAGPWAAGERLLVCVNEDPRSEGLVRHAKRLADKLHAPWIALTVEGRRNLQFSDAQRDRVAQALRLADQLGGEAVTIPGAARRVADDVLGYARERNVTQIVVGKSDRSRWFEMVNGSVVHDLVRRAGAIGVHVVAGDAPPAQPARHAPAAPSAGEPLGYGAALGATALALGLAELLQPAFGVDTVSLVFLTAVVAVASRFGLYPSLLAVVASTLAYNFFFLPPIYTFTIADPNNVAALFFFTVVAVLVSNLAARTRAEARLAQARAKSTEALYGFSRKLAGCAKLDDVLWASVYQIALMLRAKAVIALPEHGALAVQAGYPPEHELDEADLAAARWAFDNDREAGRGADTLPGARRLFTPMRTGRGVIGVVGLDADRQSPLAPEERRLLHALIDQSALAIERVTLVEDLERARLSEETDRLRQALLTSISHDLKTPLAGVLGAAGALRDLGAALDDGQKGELLATVVEEAERLNRFIGNLLDMTRLESGAVAPRRDTIDAADVVDAVLRRLSRTHGARRVETALAPGLAVEADAVLLEQALFNIVDNAAKYAPQESTIRLRATREGASATFRVIDEGEGVAPEDRERIFDKFYRASKGDRVRAGTGLGLPIARGFVEAMGGTLVAESGPHGPGAMFTLTLPAGA